MSNLITASSESASPDHLAQSHCCTPCPALPLLTWRCSVLCSSVTGQSPGPAAHPCAGRKRQLSELLLPEETCSLQHICSTHPANSPCFTLLRITLMTFPSSRCHSLCSPCLDTSWWHRDRAWGCGDTGSCTLSPLPGKSQHATLGQPSRGGEDALTWAKPEFHIITFQYTSAESSTGKPAPYSPYQPNGTL